MVALARRTLIHEWRQFLPATLAVAFSGVLLFVQGALVLGIFSSASVYVSASGADLWIGFPGTQSVELGRPVPEIAELRARMDPATARVERFQWLDGDWRGPADRGGVSVIVTGIDPAAEGLLFAERLAPAQRALLLEPGSFIVDDADRDKLGLQVGEYGEINGHRMRLVATTRGLRALGGVNVLTSHSTAHLLGAPGDGASSMTYLLVKLHDPALAEATRARLLAIAPSQRYTVWTRDEFSRRAIEYWLLDTGAGLGFVLGAAVVVLVGVVITSQTLMGTIAASLREYATLRALGIGGFDLGRIVLEKSGWIGGFGVAIAALLAGAIVTIADSQFVPIAITAWMAASCAALVMVVALLSGGLAARSLRRADPSMLLR
jgi:putative ABC transport system permease protein